MGIDAGGTSYDILSVNQDGKIILKVKAGALHYNIAGPENFANHISQKITKTLTNRKLLIKNCNGICIGVAGARHKKERDELAKIICKNLNFRKISIVTDTEIARYGAFEGEDGLILIGGTGSILYGKMENKSYRIGGWGKILGDEGSGYKIGLAVLKVLCAEFDSGINSSALAKEVKKRFGITKNNIIEKIYRTNFKVQDLAELVIKLAEEKEKDSLFIIDEAVKDLQNLIYTFLTVSKAKTVNLVLSGSLIDNRNIFSEKLQKEIRINFDKKIKITKKKHSAEYGAYLIAKNKFK
jgi:N-acetylglucosamine kinase-like BadF-type ATPase